MCHLVGWTFVQKTFVQTFATSLQSLATAIATTLLIILDSFYLPLSFLFCYEKIYSFLLCFAQPRSFSVECRVRSQISLVDFIY